MCWFQTLRATDLAKICDESGVRPVCRALKLPFNEVNGPYKTR